MENQNQINTNQLQVTINKMKEVSERIEKSLSNIDKLITETVGQNVGVWDGDSANEFRTSWSNLSNEIPNYIEILQKQINNVDIMKKNIEKIEN